MSADRELLELAAKAGDMGELDFDYCEREGHGFYMGPRLPMPKGVLMAANWSHWNPLTDDGDALRLAGELLLSVSIDSGYTVVVDQQERTTYETAHGLAATRRAIVRAAAEIGRSMP